MGPGPETGRTKLAEKDVIGTSTGSRTGPTDERKGRHQERSANRGDEKKTRQGCFDMKAASGSGKESKAWRKNLWGSFPGATPRGEGRTRVPKPHSFTEGRGRGAG